MKLRLMSLGLFSLLLLPACTPEQQSAIDSMMDDNNDSAMMEDDTMMENDSMMKGEEQMEAEQHRTFYSNYAPSVLMDGQTKVLFFHAAWCPVCRSANTELEEWYAAGLPTRNVYKVDYDTETELKSKYGVTYQHTFVLVDGQGNAIETIQGPSDTALKQLIGAKS